MLSKSKSLRKTKSIKRKNTKKEADPDSSLDLSRLDSPIGSDKVDRSDHIVERVDEEAIGSDFENDRGPSIESRRRNDEVVKGTTTFATS